MPYRLDRNESVPEAIRRIAREQLDEAAAGLNGKGVEKRDEAIHEARKNVKKVRAALRLMRLELGDRYTRENAAMRRVGRKLSEFRDSAAIIETFDALNAKYPGKLPAASAKKIRAKLVARRVQAERQSKIAQVLPKIAATLRKARKRVKTWPLRTDGFPAIALGLEGSFREGRKALALARKQPRPENYHEWRKRAKDHWYHVRLLEDLWTGVMQGYEKSLKDLETWLGEDHNLVVLRETVEAEPDSYGTPKVVETLFDLIDKYQKELRDNSVSLGERIYEEKPRQFTQRMRHLWDTWQAQPKTLEKAEKKAEQQQTPPPKPRKKATAASTASGVDSASHDSSIRTAAPRSDSVAMHG